MKRLVILIACALPAIPTESMSQSGAWGTVVIYYDHPNSAYGLAWNYSSAGEAVSAAVDECNKQAGCNYREAHRIVFSTSIPKEDDYYAGAEVSTNYGRLSVDLRASRCVAIILFRVDDGYANPYDAEFGNSKELIFEILDNHWDMSNGEIISVDCNSE